MKTTYMKKIWTLDMKTTQSVGAETGSLIRFTYLDSYSHGEPANLANTTGDNGTPGFQVLCRSGELGNLAESNRKPRGTYACEISKGGRLGKPCSDPWRTIRKRSYQVPLKVYCKALLIPGRRKSFVRVSRNAMFCSCLHPGRLQSTATFKVTNIFIHPLILSRPMNEKYI